MHLFAPQARRSKSRPSSIASSELTPRPPDIFLARIYTLVDPLSFQDVLNAIDHFFSEGLLQMERLKGHKVFTFLNFILEQTINFESGLPKN